MKVKKINKKLNLNKQTIAHLGRDEMGDAKAGCITDITTFLISRIFPCDSEQYCMVKIPTATGCNRQNF